MTWHILKNLDLLKVFYHSSDLPKKPELLTMWLPFLFLVSFGVAHLVWTWGHYTGEVDLVNPGFAVVTVSQHRNPARTLRCSPSSSPLLLGLLPACLRAWAALWNLGQRQNIRQGIGLSLWVLCLSLRNLNPRWGKPFSAFLRLLSPALMHRWIINGVGQNFIQFCKAALISWEEKF